MSSSKVFDRLERLIGPDGLRCLSHSAVVVVGLGAVGSFCAEALARSGVGMLRIVDHDDIAASNCNRQLHATSSTIGQPKVEVMARRLSDIHPNARIEPISSFFDESMTKNVLAGLPASALVVDAIDALGPKVELIYQALQRRVRIVTVLGGAARLDPTMVRVTSLDRTRIDPLAAQVRKRLRRRGAALEAVRAVYSEEPPRQTHPDYVGPTMTDDLFRGRQRMIQPSAVMVPAAMGMAAAAEAIRQLLGNSSTIG